MRLYMKAVKRREQPLDSGFAFGFAEAGDAVAGFPLAAFLEEFEALKAFEHVSFTANGGGGAQAAML